MCSCSRSKRSGSASWRQYASVPFSSFIGIERAASTSPASARANAYGSMSRAVASMPTAERDTSPSASAARVRGMRSSDRACRT